MKHWKKIIFVIVFLGLSALLTIYTYAYFDTLDISETRKSITIYDKDGNVLYESNFKKNMEQMIQMKRSYMIGITSMHGQSIKETMRKVIVEYLMGTSIFLLEKICQKVMCKK